MDSSSSNAIVTEIKYKGVRKRKWGKYVCEIRLPNSRERIWLGSYDTAEKAARAFDAALFCLRGHRAKFNFPDDPPDIVGGQSLAPAEIQVVAQQYGNSYGGISSCQPPPPAAAHSSDCDGEVPVDLVDWSFWDAVDSNGGGINDGDVSGYGLFPEPGDMYMGPYFEEMSHQDDEYGYFSHGNHVSTSSLWNF